VGWLGDRFPHPSSSVRWGSLRADRGIRPLQLQMGGAGDSPPEEIRTGGWVPREAGQDSAAQPPRIHPMLTIDYDRLGLRPGDRVLDIGCGEGRHSYEAFRLGASLVVSLDMDRDAVATTRRMLRLMQTEGEARGHFTAVRGDANRLPFPDASFDRVICAETLEHIPSDGLAIGELQRVLRPGGRLGVTVPRRFPEQICWAVSREYREAPGGHVRIYRASELERALAATGLRPLGGHHAHALHSPYWWVRCMFGAPEDGAWLSRQYERLLVWDIEHAPTALGTAERLLNPLLGKSVALYFEQPGTPSATREPAHRSANGAVAT